MSDMLFPAGLIVDRPDLTIEMMQHYAKMWNIEHTQLGKGVFNGSLLGVHTPHIQIGISHYSQGVMSIGDFPDGCVVLHYSVNEMKNDPNYNFHNRLILPHEVLMLTQSEGYDRITYSSGDIDTIAIKEDLFYKEFYAYFGETDSLKKNKRFYLKEDKISLFHQIIVSWISYLINEFPKLTIKPEYDKIESEILHQLFDCMELVPLVKKRKKFQTKIVRDILDENITNDIDISTLTSELNIKSSQLHNAFKKEYGVSPKKYLQTLRYNAIRKVLLLSDPNSVTIAEVASKYKISHMSHFSVQYKNIFGETPSQTLRHH